MRQKLSIRTTDAKFYRQYLELIKVFPPVSKLSSGERNVLAEIMRANNEFSKKFKDPEDAGKWPLLMSLGNRKVMRKNLDIPEASWNNALSALRKAGILVSNELTPSFRIYPQKSNTISFEFNIEKNIDLRIHKDESGGTGNAESTTESVSRDLHKEAS